MIECRCFLEAAERREFMKKVLILIGMVSLMVLSTRGFSLADDFLGAPVMPGGATVKADKRILEKVYNLPKEQVLAYYRDIFKDSKDIKFRDRGERSDIDEYGNQPWQKIMISSDAKGQTMVVIEKDSWTWILGTLTIRFVGVFVVLVVLFAAMVVATSLIRRAEKAAAKEAIAVKPTALQTGRVQS
jgi:hypothetical protein